MLDDVLESRARRYPDSRMNRGRFIENFLKIIIYQNYYSNTLRKIQIKPSDVN